MSRGMKRKQDRYFQWYKTLYQWLLIHQDKVQITDFFKNHGYKRVAIYGMGELGRLFLKELNNTEVEVPFAIDRNAHSIITSNIKVVTLAEAREDADVIVVTVIDKFDAVKADIEKHMNVPVISLEDVLFSL